MFNYLWMKLKEKEIEAALKLFAKILISQSRDQGYEQPFRCSDH